MNVLVDLLIGVASAVLFFIVQKYLIDWPYPWDLVSAALVFGVSTGAAFILRGKKGAGTLTMSRNKVKKNMKGKIERSEIKDSAEILSGNEVGGDADFNITDSKF